MTIGYNDSAAMLPEGAQTDTAQQNPAYRARRLQDALTNAPQDSHLLAELGRVEVQLGQVPEAVAHLTAARVLRPDDPDLLRDLADALTQAEQKEPAAALYTQLIARDPGQAPLAYGRLASLALQMQQEDDAWRYCEQALALTQENEDVWCIRAILNLHKNNLPRALTDIETALRLNPHTATAHNCHGKILQNLERREEAEAAFRRALTIAPTFIAAIENLSYLLMIQKRASEALPLYDLQVRLTPNLPDAYNNRAGALIALDAGRAALADVDRALALAPDNARAWYNRAAALTLLQRHSEAITACDHALTIDPDYSAAWNCRGNAQEALQNPGAALADYDKALALTPQMAEAIANRGNALRALGHYHEARDAWRKAIQINPQMREAEWNLALIVLLLGDYKEGWSLFESRWQGSILKHVRFPTDRPVWRGEDIRGKRILLFAEQGLGDTLQFCRYAPLVAARGAEVFLMVPRPLMTLLQSLPGNIPVLEQKMPPRQRWKAQLPQTEQAPPLPDVDLQCPLMSLPRAFDTREETIPAHTPYLTADPARVADWGKRLGVKTMPRIGLVWSGNPGLPPDKARSMAAHHLAPLLSLPLELHCLQKEIRPADAETLKEWPQLHTHCDALQDFCDTAALAAHMDLVISVDTSVAHMAGATGRPLWMMIPFVPDWRWHLDRRDSLWYPGTEIFRQPARGDWDSVVAEISALLRARFC